MKKSAIMGVDFGLSKINSTLTCIENGKILLDSEFRYKWDVQANNWMETNPEQLWEVSQRAAEEVIARCDFQEVEICAIVLSCFGETIVPVDRDGNHLYPIIGSNDIRANRESMQIKEGVPDYSQIAGGNIAPSAAASKILWLRNNRPEIFGKTASFYSLQEYILRKMGAHPMNDYTLASRKMLYDLRRYEWSTEITRFLEIAPEQLGVAGPSAETIDELDHYGRVKLPHKVPVVIGAHDACSSALGLGIHPKNDGTLIGNNSGTWNLMNLYYNHFVDVSENAPKLTPGCGPVRGSYYYQAAGAVGPVLDWFIRTFSREGLNELSKKAVYDGSCHVRLQQDPMEGSGVFSGLSLTDELSDVFTGLIESVTFPMKDMLIQFENLTGRRFEAMRISAGGAKADNWVQLKANVMNIAMERVSNLQASALGAAINAAVGIGAYADYDEAIRKMVQVEKVFEPDSEMVKRYQERNEEFRELGVKGPCFFL